MTLRLSTFVHLNACSMPWRKAHTHLIEQSFRVAPRAHPLSTETLTARPRTTHPSAALGASQTDALAFKSPSATALSPSTHVSFVCFESAMSARTCHQESLDAIGGQLGGSSWVIRCNRRTIRGHLGSIKGPSRTTQSDVIRGNQTSSRPHAPCPRARQRSSARAHRH